ncbi:MAG: ATP-binding protein [Eubacteriales bacterium]|nr:ATP-binding protein [Eubacteriales bacterium]
MTLQQLLSSTRKCIDTYNLIDENDNICLAVSGGKDSLSMSVAFKNLQKFYPKKFNIKAICIDLGFKNVNFDLMRAFFDKLDVELYIIKTDISSIVFDIRKEENPCSLCAKMRKGALNAKAKELKMNKIALAHNMDDFIETSMMSLLYEGSFYTFKANTYLDRTDLHVIRPLIFTSEYDIIGFANSYNLPILKNPCLANGNTKRQYVKNLIKELGKENPGFQKSLFNACKQII